jgi:WD40 repeat protein
MTQNGSPFPTLAPLACLTLILLPLLAGAQDGPREISLTESPEEHPRIIPPIAHSHYVRSLVVSKDGQHVLSASEDGTMVLWELRSGRIVQRYLGHEDKVMTARFSPDGEFIASGSRDQTIRLWQVKTGREAKKFRLDLNAWMKIDGQTRGSGGRIHSLAFSPSGKHLLCGSASGVWLLEVESGRQIRHYDRGKILKLVTDVFSVAFSPKGDKIAGGYWGGVYLWDTETGDVLLHLEGHKKTVTSVAFAREGDLIVSGSEDATVRLWDSRTGEAIHEFTGHRKPVHSVAVEEKRELALSGSEDGTLRLLDLKAKKEIRHFENQDEVTAVAFSPGGEYILGGGFEVTQIWRREDGGLAQRLYTSTPGVLLTMALSRDGRFLAYPSFDYNIHLVDLKRGQEISQFKGHEKIITSIAFSPCGKFLASGSKDKTIRLWNVEQGKAVQRFEGFLKEVVGVTFSPKGRYIALGAGDDIYIWDFAEGKEPRKLAVGTFTKLFGHGIRNLTFSPDGKYVLGNFWNPEFGMKLWEVETGQQVQPPGAFGGPFLLRSYISGHKESITSLAFSPNGRFLLTGSHDRTARLWDRESGAEIYKFRHDGEVDFVTIIRKGEIALTVSGQTICLWDLQSGEPLGRYPIQWGFLIGAAYMETEGLLVMACDDGIHFWDVEGRQELAAYVPLGAGRWLSNTPQGLFDGTPETWEKTSWRLSSKSFELAPVEIFFNEFFYPNLLPDILSGKRPRPPRTITEIDRRQPRISVALTGFAGVKEFSASSRTVDVEIEIAEAPPDGNNQRGSGAKDVRLFRNRSLVKIWPGDVLQGNEKMTLQTSVPIVAGENRLSAYAFSQENIKSQDATIRIVGADNLKRKGTAYILAVGVNQYSNTDWNLNFAVNDAKGISEMLDQSFNKLKAYAQVVPVTLLNGEGSKANILTVFDLLSGIITSAPSGAPDELKKLRRAEPEDDIIIFFSGHGMADQDRYYLIPHDMEYQGRRVDLDKAGREIIMKHSLSDKGLNIGFEKIDAGRMMLIIDACQSGQALEAEEKRRGPMNSRGLAQLAYEKGMYILAAAQSFQAALEFERLGHGLLTYVLIEEGLKKLGADTSPKDGKVTAEEWLDYATQHAGREADGAKAQYAKKKGGEQIDGSEVTVTGQSPRAYYRRERVGDAWVVGRR